MAVLRVGFDTGPLHGPRTGIGHAVAALHDALAARDDIELVPYLVSLRARPAPPTVRLPFPAAVAHRSWSHTARPAVDRWLEGAQLVHGTNYVVPPSKLPRLVSVYDCWFLRNRDEARAEVRRAGRVLARSVHHGAVVHASSHATAAAVADLLPGAHVHTVHLGALPLPEPAAAPPIAELADHPFVLAVGTVERRKNLPRLVAAFGQIAHDHPDVRLVVGGPPGDDQAATIAAVDALGPESAGRVLFTGRIDDATRGWLLRAAVVLAYPSLDEGFGFPLLEAMQARVPVVAARAGSIPEVAGDAAALCDPLDTASIAAALDRVLSDAHVRDALVVAGDQQWPRFTWARCAAEMVDVYRALVEDTTP